MVETMRLELTTSAMRMYCPGKPGGVGQNRTGDLANANRTLYQLSYYPKRVSTIYIISYLSIFTKMVFWFYRGH